MLLKISKYWVKKTFFLCTALLLNCFGVVYGQITLPSVFSDNMVLQRQSKVKFWGWAGRGSTVKVIPSWNTDTLTVKANGHAKFEVEFSTPQAGGPYTITVLNGRFEQMLQNVLIGEVWLASGQSNMEWSSLNGLKEMIDELPRANNDQIRLLHVNRHASYYPQENFSNKWQISSSESANGFSAIGYFFAKKLQQELGVPVGIISSNIGGTNAEVWIPDTVVNNDPILAKDASMYTPSPSRPHEPGTLWNTMIYPVAGYNLAGFLWYQGESNVARYSHYSQLMTKLVHSWRKAWGAELPFYYVQIAPNNYKSKTEEQKGSLLREQQAKLLQLNKTGMVVVSDLVDNVNDIHPIQKKEVASRLADLALVDTYGRPLTDYKSPVYKSHHIDGNKVTISFDFLEEGLMVSNGKNIIDLFIADESKVFKPAQYQIKGNQLIVFNDDIRKPVAVRFAFTDVSVSNLFSKSGLPVSPFRTDNWAL